jgi:L-alanine-DL-glutamate epimerase-like enolase superfamily enzyme
VKLRLLSATLHRTETRTRMPFRFGIAVMTEAPHVFLQCTYEVNGKAVTGIAAEGLLPKWFDKTPDKSSEQEIEEMLLVIRKAVAIAREIPASTAFDFWRQLYDAQMPWAAARGLPPLLAHFGVSMVERTLLDALARTMGVNLSTLLRTNQPGIDLGEIHPELAGRAPAEFLPARPLAKVVARHTVGLSDPLTAADVLPADKLNDGLPQTLEECISFYGLHHFKLKVRGDVQADLARLKQVAQVVTRLCGGNYAFTLDGNEQYKTFPKFVELWDQIQADAALAKFFETLIFIEQPLHRSVALDPAVAKISEWRNGPPMIIDESDAEIGDLARALQLGYAGTSHKNCKGVMKGVAHRCLINHRNAIGKTSRYQMSGEDLVNIGPVALLQDLAAQAALGNETVERNGHHYFRGLSPFPAVISQAMLVGHGDLYTKFDRVARLDVRQGELRLGSVNAAPFGIGAALPMEWAAVVPITD